MAGVDADAGAPQIPALLFSFANWPRAGEAVVLVGFLMLALALPHRAPKASPPAAGAAGLEAELVTGFMLPIVLGVLTVFEDIDEKPDIAEVPVEAALAGCAWIVPK